MDEDDGDKKPAAKDLDTDDDDDDDDQEEDMDEDEAEEEEEESSDDEDGEDFSESSDDDDDDDDNNNDGLSEYEKLRLERIKRNQERLAQLGLEKGSGIFGSLKKPPKPSKRERRPRPTQFLPRRNSRSRSAKKRINYSTDIDIRLQKPRFLERRGRPRRDFPKKTRMVKWIYDEFKRISKQRKQNLKRAKRSVKAATKELKYWNKKMGAHLNRKRRSYEFERRQLHLLQERQDLGGMTQLELLRDIERRTPELRQVVAKYDSEEAEKARVIQEQQESLEEQQRKESFDRKLKMIDALDRFPKALSEATSSLDSMLYQRSPNDPPPPRRSRRTSDVTEISTALEEAPQKSPTPSSSWADMVVDKPIEIMLSQDDSNEETSTEATKGTGAPPRKRSKKEVAGRNVGGWISPPLAKELNRSWLERETVSAKPFDLASYVPQVGDTVLYYTAAHKAFMKVFPDVLGQKMNDSSRKPLLEQAKAERNKKRGGDSSWWTKDWIDNDDDEKYPVICRVESTIAEFPDDPYKSCRIVEGQKITWKLPKQKKIKRGKANILLAVTLKPLTPVLPPVWSKDDSGTLSVDDSANLGLPPTFTVCTCPSNLAEPFLIPFSWAYCLTHSISKEDPIVVSDDKDQSAKAKVLDFHMHEDEEMGTFRLEDKIQLIAHVLEQLQSKESFQEAIEEATGYEERSDFSVTDASFVVDFLQTYIDGQVLRLENRDVEGSLLDLVRSTLPLYKGIQVLPNVYQRQTLSLSRWDFTVRNTAKKEEIIPGLRQGLLHTLEDSLRNKIVCSIKDFVKSNEDAEIFQDIVTEADAPNYYHAVPIGMHFQRILNRLKGNRDSRCYYTSIESVLSDLQSIASNCLLYNSVDSDVVKTCLELIPRIKKSVSNIYAEHLRKERKRIKAEEERKQYFIRGAEYGKMPAALDDSNTVYEKPLYRKWLQRIKPDASWSILSKAHVASNADASDWLPQSGDTVFYSRALHSKFIKGHMLSLTEGQCVLPNLVPGEAAAANFEKKVKSKWLVGIVVGVRASFPRSLEDDDQEESFDMPTPILVVELRFPYSWSKGEVHHVCWRPCCIKSVDVCSSCGLDDESFLKPAWLHPEANMLTTDKTILNGFDEDAIESRRIPQGINDSNSNSILRCFDVLKRRCLQGVDPGLVDAKACLESADKGDFKASKGSRPLPSFEEFFDQVCDQTSKVPKTIRTRKIRNSDSDDKIIESLSKFNLLPSWTASWFKKSEEDSTLMQQDTMMAFPCLCLELIYLRLQSGYYRQPAAIVNDLSEAYVTTVLYLLSEPASRKKKKLSIRKVSLHFSSSEKEHFVEEEIDGFSEDERTWVASVAKVRQLYSMAIVCITNTDDLLNIFGLSQSKGTRVLPPRPPLQMEESNPHKNAALHRIRYLLNAVSKDECKNKIPFPSQLKIKPTCNGKFQDGNDVPKQLNMKITCNGQAMQKKLVGILPVPKKPLMTIGFQEMHMNDDLARRFIGRPGRMYPCVRCQVYQNSMLTCRFTMAHSNPDFAFYENFKNLGGVDGLLRLFYNPRQMGDSHLENDSTPVAHANSRVEGDPTANLKKAELTMQLASLLHKQAQILSDTPVTLDKDFIKTYFPVDPTDGHYVFCIVCGRSGNLLCCEGCPTVVHADCIGLRTIPEDDWFCKECAGKPREKAPTEVSKTTTLTESSESTKAKSGSSETEQIIEDEKAPSLPAPPQSVYPAYFQFANVKRKEMKAQHPEKSNIEISRIVSDMWKESSDEFKQPYFEEETKQRGAYKIAMQQYQEKLRGSLESSASSSFDSAVEFIRKMKAAAVEQQQKEESRLLSSAESGSVKEKMHEGSDKPSESPSESNQATIQKDEQGSLESEAAAKDPESSLVSDVVELSEDPNEVKKADDDDDVNSKEQEDEGSSDTEEIEHPRRFTTAYFLFANAQRAEVKKANPNADNGEISKMLSSIWKESSDEFKEPFYEEEKKQRENYKIEMDEYKKKVSEKQIQERLEAGISEEDLQAPVKPYPAYFQFANSKRQEVKDANPFASNGEISKMLSSMWKGSNDDFKEPYYKEEARQRVIYREKLEEYREKMQEIYERRALREENEPMNGHAVERSPEPLEVNTDDIEPPQKPYPAYFQFANCRRLEIKAANPGISSVEITRTLGAMWQNASDEFKSKFVEEEARQRKVYRVAMEEYERKVRERYVAFEATQKQRNIAAAAAWKAARPETEAPIQETPSPKRRAKIVQKAISDQVFEEQNRNLEALLKQLQAYHPAPIHQPAAKKGPYGDERLSDEDNDSGEEDDGNVLKVPVVPLDSVFTKTFDNLGDFKGKVTKVADNDSPYYTVEYEDGDTEELTLSELLDLLSPNQRKAYEQECREYEASKLKRKLRRRKRKEANAEASKPKRGRGRPRKYPIVEDTPVPKRGRGRPRKVQASIEIKSQEKIPALKRGRGRPRKVNNYDESPLEEATPEETLEETPSKKRGRGRPRKVDNYYESPLEEETPEETLEETPSKKRGRGRTRKINTYYESPLKQDTPEKTPGKRGGRGRPRKVQSNISYYEEDSDVEIIEPKRKRGRPRRNART